MDNQKIAQLIGEIYNNWWVRWRKRRISRKSPAWEMMAREAGEILDKYEHHPLAVHLILDLLNELERRSVEEEESNEDRTRNRTNQGSGPSHGPGREGDRPGRDSGGKTGRTG